MKLLISGDWHDRNTKPKNRIDDFPVTVKRKIGFLKNYAYDNNMILLQPGDYFDSVKIPLSVLLNHTNPKYLLYSNFIFSVFGQHDLEYHGRDKTETPLNFLSELNYVTILGEEPKIVDEDVHFYGASWGEEIPEIKDQDAFNVLVMHKMVVDEKLWEAQKGHISGNRFIRHTKYNLVVCGDNHTQFVLSNRGRFLFNAGSLLRTNSNQLHHIPKAYIFDTDKRDYEELIIPIEPPEVVFNLERIEKEKEEKIKADENDQTIDSFIEMLPELKDKGTTALFTNKIYDLIGKDEVMKNLCDEMFGSGVYNG